MSKDTIINMFHIIDQRQWNELSSVFCDQATYERPGYPPFVGFERVLHFYQTERIIASGNHELEHILIEGDYGACWGRFRGKSKDGNELDEQFVDVYTFSKGRVQHRKSYFFRAAI